MRSWKPFIGAAVLAATLVAQVAADPPAAADISQQLKAIDAGLRAMSDKIAGDINGIKGNIEGLRRDLDALRTEMDTLRQGLKTEQVRGANCDSEVIALKRRLEEVQALCKKETDSLRRSFSYTPGAVPSVPLGPNGGSDSASLPPDTPPPPPAVGNVLLRNFSDVNGTFFINGRPYAVLAGRSAEVRNIPAGTFTFEIQAEGFGVIRPFSSRYLPAGGTYTLAIDPRPVVAAVCP